MLDEVLTAKDLGIPSLPPGGPTHLEHILDELNQSLDSDAPSSSLRFLKQAFSFIAAYTADLVEGVASVFGELKFDFQQSGDADEAIEAIRKGIEFLHSDAPQDLVEVKALVDVFFQDGTAKKFARLLEIGGKPRRGTMPLAKFLQSPIPIRKKCVQEVRQYIPFLKEWIEALAGLFAKVSTLSERTSLQGRQTIRVQLGNQTIEVGKRIDIAACPLCVPEKEIDIPLSLYERPVYFFVPQKSPKFLADILGRLDDAMKAADPVAGCLELRNALEFLIRYFAGVASKVLEDLGTLPKGCELLVDASASIVSSEKLLNRCLTSLRQAPDSLAAKTVIGVFYRRNEFFEFIPRWHTEILSLHGQLSGWCQLEPGYGELETPEVCKLEFEKHVPTLREWLVALGGYLPKTEHFFNEPKKEGYVEFSLRIGDRFLEIGEPGYVLWLNNPRPEGEVVELEGGEAAKPLIRESIEIPKGCPGVLARILTRMDIYLRLGDPIESCVSLRDALDYLTRYYAGLAAAAFRKLGTLPPEAEELAQQSLSIHDCEKLLILALRSIGQDSDERLGLAVRSVFYYIEELSQAEKPTGAHARMLALDADPSSKMQNLAEFCSLKAGVGVLSHPARSKRELERFLPTLQDWLAMSGSLFSSAKHHEEPPEADGKTELIIEFDDVYLELVEPDYTFYIRPGADEVPDIEAPELPPPDFALDDDVIDAPTRKKSPEEAALDRSFLVHRVDLIGDRPNSKGKKCAAGYIVLTNAGGGTLSGTALATDPAIEVEPARFRGNRVQLSYWIDTDEIPTAYEIFILLKTAHEERTISVYEMIGQARAKPVSKKVGILSLLLPVVFWLGLFVAAFHGTFFGVNKILTDMLGPSFTQLRLATDAIEAYSATMVWLRILGYFFLFVAGIIPVFVARRYRRLPPATQELLKTARKWFMLSPAALVGFAVMTPILSSKLSSNVDFASVSPHGRYLYFLGLNIASTYYQEMSLSQKLDDLFIHPDLRKLVPVIGWFVFLTTILLGVAF